ncbi:MAG TPA: enoyl-CoA hydratase-related protein [Deltaproteobacteria bacterium]|nr:enoyl-CoA hydratase-related protein [Deltaproteobacteria bacterium]HQI81966.1 enoyl-CoA hydratase-related protein [Deltaproteobacteria bacterium]
MELETVLLEQSEGIAVIRMNRPREMNTLNFQLTKDLLKALEANWDDAAVKVLVITGTGKAFCAGGDVAAFRGAPDIGDATRQMTKDFDPLVSGIRRMAKPVIAMVNGICMGAGLSLAAACDLRISAASAVFRQAYTSVGLTPDGAWGLTVPLLIGFGRASELVFSDPTMDAKKAYEIGLVNEVVEDAELENTVRKRAQRLAAGPLAAFAVAKDNLNRAMLGLLEAQLEQERLGIVRAGRTADAREGIAAILEKRRPAFRGE